MEAMIINFKCQCWHFILSETPILKVYHNTFFGDRDFFRELTAPADENYRDLTNRSLSGVGKF